MAMAIDRPLAHAARELVRESSTRSHGVGDPHRSRATTASWPSPVLGDVLVGADGLGDLPPDGVHGIERGHRVLEDHGDADAPRTEARSFSFARAARRPGTVMEPRTCAFFGSSPMVASAVTDFPDPDSPTMPRTSLGGEGKSIPRTACTTASPVGRQVDLESWTSSAGTRLGPIRPAPGSSSGRRLAEPVADEEDGEDEHHQETHRERQQPPFGGGRVLALVIRSPSETSGGWMPSPRNDRVDSSRCSGPR